MSRRGRWSGLVFNRRLKSWKVKDVGPLPCVCDPVLGSTSGVPRDPGWAYGVDFRLEQKASFYLFVYDKRRFVTELTSYFEVCLSW